MHDLKLVLMAAVRRKISHQCIPKLTPVIREAADTNSHNVETVAVVIATTWIAFGGTRLLQLNLRHSTIAYGLDLNANGYVGERYHGKIMHPVFIVAFVAGQPTFLTGDSQFSLEMDFCDSALQCNLKAKSLVDCIEQFQRGQAVFQFQRMGHVLIPAGGASRIGTGQSGPYRVCRRLSVGPIRRFSASCLLTIGAAPRREINQLVFARQACFRTITYSRIQPRPQKRKATGPAIRMESTRSSTPPKPGIQRLESLRPTERFSSDSARSPSVPAALATRA